ncbi:MAG: hypothetical protein CVU89_04325 [Firmicutes bacterium HGW-Firmicutes-14]|jgi:hypothetical protein|nr:MAG: hypothetical protein CVU89_04325 [Firmicutes bacterium HGW-Firmicutes-14]
MEGFTKIAVLENEIEAQLLGSILKEREIPHGIRSYYDLAYDGIFQMHKGWGAIYAPEEFSKDIIEVLEEVRKNI